EPEGDENHRTGRSRSGLAGGADAPHLGVLENGDGEPGGLFGLVFEPQVRGDLASHGGNSSPSSLRAGVGHPKSALSQRWRRTVKSRSVPVGWVSSASTNAWACSAGR